MKRTITILLASLLVIGFASCMGTTTGNKNHNPAAARIGWPESFG